MITKLKEGINESDKLLFLMTQVLLFTLGAWERTSGLRSLHGGYPFSNFVTAKSVFKLQVCASLVA